MKRKYNYLFLIVALVFMFTAINAKATCASSGNGLTECSGVTCSSYNDSYSGCASAGGSVNHCCTWTDPTCPTGQHVESHVCVDNVRSCPAGQEPNAAGDGCQACQGSRYKPNDGEGSCRWCDGTVNSAHTTCTPTQHTATVTASANPTTITGGGTSTVTGTVSPSISGSASCSWPGGTGCTVTCPDEDKLITVDVSWSGAPSNYTVTKGSVTITCKAAEGTDLDHINASNTTVYASAGESTGLSLSAKDANNKPVKVTWSSSNSSLVSVAGCSGSAQCGSVVTAVKCTTKKATVTATDSNGHSDSVTITVVGYDAWKKVGDEVDVPQDKNGHTKHEAEVSTGDMGDRCVAYESVNPTTGKGEKWDRCCGSGTIEVKYCYEKPDGTREITTYHEGYVKKDDKYCQKACYKKTDNTYEVTYYEDGYKKVEDRFCDSTPTPHCYKKPDGTYVKEVYQDGYVQVDDKYCVKKCYLKPDGTYEETNYQDGYVEAEADKCAEVPPTGVSVSNILYACGAFLVILGSGIVVYQLTKVKQQLN